MLTPPPGVTPGGRLAARVAAPVPRRSAPAGELTDDKLAVYVGGQVGQVAGGQQVRVFLGPEDGLMLADRIRRAVDIVLEIGEDEPETETATDREYQLPPR